ncbi:transcription initiation factor TFIID subunit 4-like isoform X1 [Falco naumanni]|uniref:transcription initiation factor TFIID subunit 4-like isoform X1 n=1 Tax=Falco naumanni TaxID=148594 RepID=UPI001ADE6578|nr:transcription initiation factor TFIID subunit 4-like isoform X1 [Falco naumanni]
MAAAGGAGRALPEALLCAVCLLCARPAPQGGALSPGWSHVTGTGPCHPATSLTPGWPHVTGMLPGHWDGPLSPHCSCVPGPAGCHPVPAPRQVAGGPAAGFLLQALAAASDALEPLWPGGGPDPLPGTWVSAMLGQPLVAFGLHRLSGDRATANLLLGGAVALAPAAAQLPEEARLLAARAVTVLTAATVLILAALTANGPAALGSLLMAAAHLLPPGTSHGGHPWVLAAGNLALRRALRAASHHPPQ